MIIKLKDLLTEAEAILDEPGAQVLAQRMSKEIRAPYVEPSVSTLGGKHRPSVMLRVSLDPRNTWANGIYHNSRGAMWHVHYDGVLEQHYYSMYPEPRPYKVKAMRKTKFKTHDEAIKKINDWIAKAI